MLTIQRCREILGKDCALSDAELENLRDQLYGLADVAVSAFLEARRSDGTANVSIDVNDSGVGHIGNEIQPQALISTQNRGQNT